MSDAVILVAGLGAEGLVFGLIAWSVSRGRSMGFIVRRGFSCPACSWECLARNARWSHFRWAIHRRTPKHRRLGKRAAE